jgi:hypothetical protein
MVHTETVEIVLGNSYFVQSLQGRNYQKLLVSYTWESIILSCGNMLVDIMADTLLQVYIVLSKIWLICSLEYRPEKIWLMYSLDIALSNIWPVKHRP